MVVYGEYLFIENMITGLLILHFSAKIVGKQVQVWRMLIIGICCGFYAFILFTPIHGILSLAGKTLFSIAMGLIAFGKASPSRILKNGMIFLFVTVVYGGIAIAILTSFGWIGVTAASGIYLPPLTYLVITAVAAGSAWILFLLLRLLREKRMEDRVISHAEITLCGRTWRLKGLIDSGNRLKEPLTGKPVCIVQQSLMEELLGSMDQVERRYTLIPYHGVGVEKSLLEGYRMDQLRVEGYIWKSPVLAVCHERCFLQEAKDIQILLPSIVLERGLQGDVTEV